MNTIDKVFSNLDDWRHLPAYQLERRADILFSLFLKDALEKKFDYEFELLDSIIPEFPIKAKQSGNNHSIKVDYVMFSAARDKIILVELKTDITSIRDKQLQDLEDAKNVALEDAENLAFNEHLKGIVEIFKVSNQRRKYYHLLENLEASELLKLPVGMKELMLQSRHNGIKKLADKIEIPKIKSSIEVVFIMPDLDEDNDDEKELKGKIEGVGRILPFSEFAKTVSKHDDALSQRFAESLDDWVKIKAGQVM